MLALARITLQAHKVFKSRLYTTTTTMALHQAPEKLIFAPAGAGAQSTGQAAQFTLSTLTGPDLSSTPITQFHTWFRACGLPHPNAPSSSSPLPAVAHPETCTLSTAELPSGRISSRIVYLKELDSAGHFVIYSNFGTSRKAHDLATNPHVALVFWWEALQRQVRVEGTAERMGREESQVYYDTRARGSRIGAWASRQSQVLERGGEGDDGRGQLEGWVKEVEERFEGEEKIPVPEFWGGLRIKPERVEFWQGRDSRLHDRFVYVKEGEGWKVERLSP